VQNLYWGIFTISVCLILYWRSYLFAKNNLYTKAFLLIILGGLFLRIYVSSDGYLHEWDEKYHALVAKNMMQHPLKPTLIENPALGYDYKNFTANHIWLEKGPVPLLAISLSLKLFGLSEFSVRIPSIILSLLAVYLTYLIAQMLFDKKTAILAAFFHSINGYLIELTGGGYSSDHVETAFLFYTELSFFLVTFYLVKKRSIFIAVLIGLATGFAILSKWSPALLVFPVWIIGVYFSKNISNKTFFLDLTVAFVTVVVLVLPYEVFTLINYTAEASHVIKKFLFAYTSSLEGHSAPWYYYINQIGIIFGEAIFIPLLLSLFQIAKKQVNWRIIFLTSWWLIPTVIFSMAETKRSTYLLISAPSFFIILSYYCIYFYQRRDLIKPKWAINLLLLFLIGLPIRYSFERVKPFQIIERNPQWVADLKTLNKILGTENNIVIFNMVHNTEAMFYTDYTVYKDIPTLKQINILKKKGYRIIINDADSSLPDRIKNIPGIEIITLVSTPTTNK
jgi:4-amino-4-deoxy-L-arabinose transferase